ncbi:MAG: bifunctional folylpolyglutamate synthase/dihydrofolate synthase, partial [Marinosulfonomonas sp.]|nr:bifunctional folylpolyglutamate synthase/dihydrofolate synthase [Marinosulfonomonas sp.]
LTRLPERPLHLICGMLNTKDVGGYMRPLAPLAKTLHAIPVPNEVATLSATDTRKVAQNVGMTAFEAGSTDAALGEIIRKSPNARILICGSLYLAGHVLRHNS